MEKRSMEVKERREAGPWKMNLVVSAKGGRKSLLAPTECRTRYEYILLLKDKSQKSACHTLNKLERKYGSGYPGNASSPLPVTESLDFPSQEKSCINKAKQTKIFYTHLFSFFEQGSDRKADRLIIRILQKKSISGKLTRQDVGRLVQWMNLYPRPSSMASQPVRRRGRKGFTLSNSPLRGKRIRPLSHFSLQFS